MRGNLRLFPHSERAVLHSLSGGSRGYLLRHWPKVRLPLAGGGHSDVLWIELTYFL